MLVTIASYLNPWEAEIVRARLEADGVPATLANHGHVSVNWQWSMALGGSKVQVPVECRAQALEIVAAYHAGELQAELEAELEIPPECCPTCGSTSFTRYVPVAHLLLVLLVLFPTFASRRRCNACATRWSIRD